jgi:hypothetical protein
VFGTLAASSRREARDLGSKKKSWQMIPDSRLFAIAIAILGESLMQA